MVEGCEKPNIVATYKFGNSIVHIADNAYRDRTQEEINQTIDNIKRIASDIIIKNELKKRNA